MLADYGIISGDNQLGYVLVFQGSGFRLELTQQLLGWHIDYIEDGARKGSYLTTHRDLRAAVRAGLKRFVEPAPSHQSF